MKTLIFSSKAVNSHERLYFTLALYPLFHVLFWGQAFGLNVALFSFAFLCIALFLYPPSRQKNWQIAILLACVVWSGLMFLWYYSLIAWVAHVSSFMVAVIFLQAERFRVFFYAVLQSVLSLVKAIAYLSNALYQVFPTIIETNWLWQLKKKFSLLLIPGFFFLVFFVIFLVANPVFANLVEEFSFVVAHWFDWCFQLISPEYVFFMLMGCWLMAFVLWKNEAMFFRQQDQAVQFDILRKRKKTTWSNLWKNLALKQEYYTAVLLMLGVNALLLTVNIIDILYIWTGKDLSDTQNLASRLHEGTYWLIASILLSMSIMLYYFRKNLNFYPRNQSLKLLAYCWIFQNMILAISVAFRTFHYIAVYGLAYKRIGVLIFLVLVFVGLFTFLIKIAHKKSVSFLLHHNSMAAFCMMLVMGSINWDGWIVSHNLHHAQQIKVAELDVFFLMTRSDKTLPILDRHQKILKTQYIWVEEGNFSPISPLETYSLREPYKQITAFEYLQIRIKAFQKSKRHQSWQAWNFADRWTKAYFE